jgi:serine/threonine protein kinase
VKILSVPKFDADTSLELISEIEKELDYVYQELELTAEVQGVEFVNLIEFFEEQDSGESLLKIYLVLELLPGGNLLSEITRCGSLSEDGARRLLLTLMRACRKMHARGIAHNDIKPENVLLRRIGELDGAVLTDMGLSQYLTVGKIKPVCGTPAYVPPEVISQNPRGRPGAPLVSIAQGTACDIWASGVVLYVLLCGSLPFGGNNLRELFYEIRNREVDFAEPAWVTVSQEAKDLVRLCLIKDPLQRVTAEQALQHPWMTK